eukprot:7108629-Prymnesium_polylepis.1
MAELSGNALAAFSRDLLHATTTGGHFDTSEFFNFSRGATYRYSQPAHMASRLPPHLRYTDELMGAMHRHALGGDTLAKAGDDDLLSTVRNKSMLILGDSVDFNLWSRMCHCPRLDRKKGHEYGESVVGALDRNASVVECHGVKDFATCDWLLLDFQIHFMDGAYGVHPYGQIPYHAPGYLPKCRGLELEQCLEAKWRRSANKLFSFDCMQRGFLRQPDLVVLNVNM